MATRLTLVERPSGVLGPISSESDVHFFCVGRDRWAIYDRRLDPTSPQALLGRLRRIAGLFEIAFVDADRPRVYCASLAESRAEFVGAPSPAARPDLYVVD